MHVRTFKAGGSACGNGDPPRVLMPGKALVLVFACVACAASVLMLDMLNTGKQYMLSTDE
jgi:hypothetical protein